VAAVQDADFSTTNLLAYSESFDVGWSKSRIRPVVANAAVAPDGQTTADYIEQEAGQTNAGVIFQGSTISGDNVFSVYAKAAEKSWVRLACIGGTNALAYFNLSTCEVGTLVNSPTFAYAESVGNGWCRLSLGESTSGSLIFGAYLADTDNSGTVTDSGGIYLWGASLTATEYPVDYIKTEASSVTKYKWFNPTEGTLAVEASSIATGTRGVIGIDDNTANERIEIQTDGTDPELLVIDGGSGPTVDAGAITAFSSFSFAGAYKDSDIAASVNGNTVVTDTGTIPIVDRMRIGALQASGTYLNGHIKRVYYWPKRLSNEALQERTE
jgi:hypothetical protein